MRFADFKCVFDVGVSDCSLSCEVHEASCPAINYVFKMTRTSFKLLQATAKAKDWLRIFNVALTVKPPAIQYCEFVSYAKDESLDLVLSVLPLGDLVSSSIAESISLDLSCLYMGTSKNQHYT